MPLDASLPMTRAEAIEGYARFLETLRDGAPTPAEAAERVREGRRWLAINDLFYLLVAVCKRADLNTDFHFARCREVQADCDDTLDLWAREHGKSSIITFGDTLRRILEDPEITIGIFSDVNKVAKPFLRQIKSEMETNEDLKQLFPDILWANPERDAPKWSEDEGIIVKRKGNPKEATVEAYGLLDGQPTGRHFRRCLFDDLVTVETVTSPEKMAKVLDRLRLADNLGTGDGSRAYVGTRYHALDAYQWLIESGLKVRKHPCTEDGTPTGKPVLMSAKEIERRRTRQGDFVFAAQMLLDPLADREQGFQREWLRYWPASSWGGMNTYILVDPSSGRKRTSGDYTAMWVVGLGRDGNRYIIDAVRDRLNLTRRVHVLFSLVEAYRPLRVGYEEYGLQADIEFIRLEQDRQHFRFDVVELGGRLRKEDRIRRLVPLFQSGRIYLPTGLVRHDSEGRAYDPIRMFVEEEFAQFPFAAHDDGLDALSRMMDEEMAMVSPVDSNEREAPALPVHLLKALKRQRTEARSWMTG